MPDISRPIQHFRDGVLIGTTPDTYTEVQQRKDAVIARMKANRAQLRSAREDARAFAQGSSTPTLGVLTGVIRQICAGLFILIQAVMDIQLYYALNDDDGAD